MYILDLTGNNIGLLHSRTFGSMTNIVEIMLLNNKLSFISNNEFTNFPMLYRLSLSNNKLQYMDLNSFQGSRYLHYLCLGQNQFPADFEFNLTGLNSLNNPSTILTDTSFCAVSR